MIMLEPRRLAARRSAEFMASLLGETIGATVGYRTRGDTRVTGKTRIEVVTEGVLTRMLHENPDLPDCAIIIFDEFHERSIHADLGLALTLDVQKHLREDLRILVMSATLDGVAVAHLLGNAPAVVSEGKSFPVDTRYLAFSRDARIESRVVSAVLRALKEEAGDVLVFLPGQREIRKVGQLLQDKDLQPEVVIHTLFGEASDESQRAAIAPARHGTRKLILSTSIAETSLTIDGVRVVVDSGLARSARFDPRRGMSGLVTLPVSQATADQRRGRAGRQQPGVCYRLWTEEQHADLPKYPTPEILVADLAPMSLDLARWGTSVDGLKFLDPPPSPHLAQANDLLKIFGALDERGSLTPHGRAMTELPVHPRLAHMLIRGKDLGIGFLACNIAAVLEDRDILHGMRDTDVDLSLRLHALGSPSGGDSMIRSRLVREAKRLCDALGIGGPRQNDYEQAGVLVALAYPERIARRRGNEDRRYQMTGGTGAVLPDWSLLAREEFLAIADVDGSGIEARVFLAAPLRKTDLLKTFAERIFTKEEVFWNASEEAVIARQTMMLGSLVIEERPMEPGKHATNPAMIEGIRQMGLTSLPWSKESNSMRSRSEWLRVHALVPEDWPDLSEGPLLSTLDDWLMPFLDGATRRSHLQKLDMTAIIRARFSYSQIKDLDRLAPATVTVPTGSHIHPDYSGEQPVLSVRLQEMFGQTDTPLIAGGKVSLLVHLLSPAGRPLAVTQDLRSFWKNAYPEVRKQMRGRYPKHHWPEDPLNAAPTKRTKRPHAH